jgi:CO/xanthine dehydrogenase FAD-binding subunit
MHQRTVPCQRYFAPQKTEEALEILSRYGEEIKVIAGGTDLLIQYYDRLYEINGWLDLKNIKELKKIRISKNQMEIGAMVTHAQLEKSEDIKGTIGGNIVNASPAGDLLAPLMAYKAKFKLLSGKKETLVAAENFFLGPKKTILRPEQLLVQIILPLPKKNTHGCWIKIGKRKALIIATITLALVVEMTEDNKIVKDVRICLGTLIN